ncbi:hypothetical protein D0Z07_7777 [Hyphodiscus hymeniophilus]|uniref:NmrA-like domain-containing protein n=1 Tax=Hyphodiscus hymeniophilus TaxID=353542 RepID=A0A9P6VDD0_9HELO|nr:hypothetical protein D0Z07_7777 [Hyphodiscus hymeniophilus]
MATSIQKIIVVIGATGNQGSSVADTFIKLPGWKVRAVTRNPSSPAAQALANSGAEVVLADLSDITSLSKSFEGAHAIFVNTDFWGTYRPLIAAIATGKTIPKEGEPEPSQIAFETEVLHGRNAAQAAAGVSTLERFVYSALPPMTKLSGGKYTHSYHWDSKGTIVDYIEKDLPDLAKISSFIYLGGYNTNALFSPKLDPTDGKYKFMSPLNKDTRMPIIDQRKSTGPFVRALIEDQKPGIKLLAYDRDSYLTIQEMADVWSRASGREAIVVQVTIDFMHEKFGLPWEVLEAPKFVAESGYTGSMKMTQPDELTPRVETRSYEEWMMGRDWDTILKTDEAAFQSAKAEIGVK